MPKSSRDLSSKERKDKLAANIAANGVIMPLKCFHCTQASVLCLTDLRTGRCVECARLGQSCNWQTTRIEYENFRRSRDKVAKELELAEAAEDNLTRRLLEHRARVRRLRQQLRIKDEKESEAQDLEAESIAEATRLEKEFLVDFVEPFPVDLPPFDSYSVESQFMMSSEVWSSLDEVPCSTLGMVGSGSSKEASASL